MNHRTVLRSPMLLPTLSLAGGVMLHEAGAGLTAGISIIAVAIIIYMVLLRLSRTPVMSLRLNRYHRIWVTGLFAGIGISIAALQAPEEIDGSTLQGRVLERVATNYGDRLTVRVAGKNCKVRIYTDPSDLRPGDIIQATGTLTGITDRDDKLPDGYAESMRRKGILYTLNVKREGDLVKIGHQETLTSLAGRLRDDIDIFIARSPLKSDTKIFLSAMLLGDRSMLDAGKRQEFADAGIAHVLALSGMHLGIISLFLLGLLLPANIFGMLKTRYAITLVILWCYAILTGLSPTIVRAAVMATCVTGGIILERKSSSLNALCTAVFILILFDAMSIYDIGMQLSVACVACLILFASRLNPVDHRSRPRLHSMAGGIVATLVATLGTWVITAWHFSRFPLLFLPVNVIVLPLLPWFVGGAIIYLLLLAFGMEAALLRIGLDMAYGGLHHLAEWGGEASVSINIGAVTVVLWLYGLTILAYGLQKAGKYGRMTRTLGGTVLLMSILTIPLFREEPPEGFIIGGNYGRIMLTAYSDGEEKEIDFRRGEMSMFETHGVRIGVIDCLPPEGGYPTTLQNVDMLILGGNFKGSAEDVDKILRPKKIILHHSIGSKSEERIREGYSGKGALHSLRHDGALHYFISK